jgi:hypothetical protein
VIPGHLPWGRHAASFVYGDPKFRAASDLAHHIAQAGRVRGLLAASTRDPAATLPTLVALWRLPAVHITVSRHQAAVWFSPIFPPVAQRIFAGRWAQAVLDLAPDDDSYLVGRRKQALRTNMTHARQLGVQVNKVFTYDEWSPAAREILRSRAGEPELALIPRMRPPSGKQEMGYFVATDDTGRPLAFSCSAIFNGCGVLTCMLSVPDHPAASASRYLLHTAMRSDLRSRGVRHLIGGTAIGTSPGLQYFQYLLGYEVRNLDITVRGPVYGSRPRQGFVPGSRSRQRDGMNEPEAGDDEYHESHGHQWAVRPLHLRIS